MRAAALVSFLLLACTCLAHANAAQDYWQKNHCTRALPAPALEKGVKGHTFKLVRKRGEALETATVGGERLTIIHFGCEGLGWQFRTPLASADAADSPAMVYDRARRLLQNIKGKVAEEARLPDVIKAIDEYTSPPRTVLALDQRLVAVPGTVETSVSVGRTAEGPEGWLTVMIYTGPL